MILPCLSLTRAGAADNTCIQLDMSCGLENAVLAVSEPEKCEYEFKVTSPALCLPLSASEVKHAEL